MKIGMMSAWNEDSGASVHAELIGREWVKRGHELVVFSFLPTSFHGTTIIKKDESFVHRCFTTSHAPELYLDSQALVEEEYEIFVVQDLGELPTQKLKKVFPLIKEHAKTVNIIHHNKLPKDPIFYELEWDAIICFDERYYRFLQRGFPEEKIHIIPYPCYPLRTGKRERARRKLRLPQEKYILLVFGQRGIKEAIGLFPILERLSKRLPLLLLVVSKHDLEYIKDYERGSFWGMEIMIREEAPDLERLYSYLHASDVLLYHRKAPSGVVVSSTIYQCLGSGCPILALESNYFQGKNNGVILYKDPLDFEEKLVSILTKGSLYTEWQNGLKRFIEVNSAPKIASAYIGLFQSLLRGNKR
jgi:glycosyltransferase involved in cell wall biosynthesis